MNHNDITHSNKLHSDKELWLLIASRLDAMSPHERQEWEPLLATLQERDRMTAQALRLAESGLKMMARNIQRMENEKLQLAKAFTPSIGPAGDTQWRVDPQPGSGGGMWFA